MVYVLKDLSNRYPEDNNSTWVSLPNL